MIEVSLSPQEIAMAAHIGCQRHIEALARHRKDQHGANEYHGWQLHVEGACGEMALAKCLGLHWEGTVNTFRRGGDVGTMQVRTRSKHDYELIIRKSDKPEAMYWLVTGVAPSYRVHGWIRGHECQKHPEWQFKWGGREESWFVPQSALNQPEDWQR